MTYTEQCEVYRYTKIDNTYAGFIPGTPVLQENAPTWFDIQQISGNDITVSLRKATESLFTVICNYTLRSFSWDDTMFITTRFGNLDIIGIQQSIRKRQYTLTCVRIEGVSDASGGQILVLYQPATPGATFMDIPALVDNELLLVFRDGICKWKVDDVTPVVPNQMAYEEDLGRLSLMPGDVYGAELITCLYKTGVTQSL